MRDSVLPYGVGRKAKIRIILGDALEYDILNIQLKFVVEWVLYKAWGAFLLW